VKVCTTCGKEYPDDQSFCALDGSSLRSTASTDLVGGVVAAYRILSKLGEGGMGTVYLGEHVKMGRKSAIKVMAKSMAEDADAIARFNREAANAARINHPSVCAIYDFGETDEGVIYLAMEFIEGEALTDIILREGSLAPKRAANILKQAADALEAAAELGIVHRDLKPDNIMVARARDGGDVVKVVDFGIAKAMGGDVTQDVTRTGLVVGTPEYMSPEQLSGDAVDGRSDIYSLGLVFFRMLTGLLPFRADSAQEVMIKRLTDEPLTLGGARPGREYPAPLQQTMDRALARMPADRYASAGEFGRDALNAVADMPDAPAGPVDTVAATKLVDTQQRPGEAVGPEGTAVIPGTRISGQSPSPTTPLTPMPASSPAPGKKRPVMAIAAVAGVLLIGGAGAAVIVTNGSANGSVALDTSTLENTATNDTATDSGPDTGSPVATTSIAAGGGGTTNTDSPGSGDGRTPEPRRVDPASTNPAWLIPTGADDHLLDMLFRLDDAGNDHAAVRDTAVAYYNAFGMSDKDKATAAYVAAIAFSKSNDRVSALDWARRAVTEDPGSTAYQQLVNDLSRGGGS
jgi:serine/threonine-protein kinase